VRMTSTCGIVDVGSRIAFGKLRSTVTVECRGKSPAGEVVTTTTYAAEIGPLEEISEVTDSTRKSIGRLRRTLAEMRDGADECAALIASLSKAHPPNGIGVKAAK